jgi:hypothetical protein
MNHLNALVELKDWVDFDRAQLVLGRALGVFGAATTSVMDVKPLLWSNNPVGEGLHKVLMGLVEAGYILHDAEADKFKLNDGFDLWKSAQRKS